MASGQIKQMVNFIMQEAHEKVNELRIKTDHDFNLEKQKLVRDGKKKVDDEYVQKEKDLEVSQRVKRSEIVGSSRVKKMVARDSLLNDLHKTSLEKLAAFTKGKDYPALLKKLIVEGLIKIEESAVEVIVRPEDKATVSKLLPEAVAEFKAAMTAAGHTVSPKVTISETPLSSKLYIGGLVLTAAAGRITLNQTLDERLNQSFNDLMPSIRYQIFE